MNIPKKHSNLVELFLLAVLILILSACHTGNSKLSDKQIIKEYYAVLNSNDFNKIKGYLSDEILSAEGDYVLSNNIHDYYILFQWDSVFTPHYELIELRNEDNLLVATVNKHCKRIEFLQDTLISYNVEIHVNKGKISLLQTNDFIVFDFEKWQYRRDSLTLWIEKNYPHLSGFINNMTPKGAVDYLKAIELYSQYK